MTSGRVSEVLPSSSIKAENSRRSFRAVGTHTKLRSSHAYCLSFPNLPDEHNYPLWVADSTAKLPPSLPIHFLCRLTPCFRPLFHSRLCTVLHEDFEPLHIICECGYEERVLAHILSTAPSHWGRGTMPGETTGLSTLQNTTSSAQSWCQPTVHIPKPRSHST